MERKGCIFYKSFYDSIKELDMQDQVKIYNAIFQYQFENKEVELNGIAKSIFTLILPQLEANNTKYENGCKGGRPKNNLNKIETKPKNNLDKIETKRKEKEKDNDKNNDKDNDNNINNMSIINNWEDNLICDEINKTNNQKCQRKSTYNINGKNYCNQHSKPIIKMLLNDEKENNKKIYYEKEELNNLFLEFLELRKKLKAVNSERAINMLLKKLSNYDDDVKKQMIERSILNSWKDVYEIKKEEIKKYSDEWWEKI